MDVIRTRYERLFSVEFLHAGYVFTQQNLISDRLSVVPDTKTKMLFGNHGIRYRFEGGTLACMIRSDLFNPPAPSPVVPAIGFDGNVMIRFLVFSSSNFLQRTQVVAAGSQQVYQFSNRANTGTNGFIAQHETGVNNDDLQATASVKPEENCFAVIDIHNNNAVNASYDLFGGDGRLLSPAFRIRFVP